ncbi:MAG: adenylate kinase [Chlamydiia bacterium]|nr:adenylate kinase [Chlamydiia bacterium]
MVVILMGPPAAGKGTQATALTDYLGLPHISTGDLFRENIRNQTPVGKTAKAYIDQGKLVPDQVTIDMLFARISHPDCQHGYILDGFPRTVEQARTFHQRLEAQAAKVECVVLNLNADDAELVERITGRMICKGCSKPYHKHYSPPQQEGVCDACGGDLYQRDDDTAAVFTKRLEVYRVQTAPLISYYQSKGLLKQIPSKNSSDQVFQEVIHALPHTPALAEK